MLDDFDPAIWRTARSAALARDPVQAREIVESFLGAGVCVCDLRPTIDDAINDSIRPDVKQILADLLQFIRELDSAITSAIEKLQSLPPSI
jgi:hypothetical protein